MASFSAKFTFDGGSDDGYDVISSNYSLGQATDEQGRPASVVMGGTIFVQFVVGDDSSVIGWMIDPYKKVNGSLKFNRIDQDSTLKEIQFEDGYCTQYSESFSSTNSSAMTCSITISARKITVGNASHENRW